MPLNSVITQHQRRAAGNGAASLAAGMGVALILLPALRAGAAELPACSLEIKVPVKPGAGAGVTLDGGYAERLAVGMLVDLEDQQGHKLAQARLTKVGAHSSDAQLIDAASAATAVQAVAPYPVLVTRVEADRVYLALPAGGRALQPNTHLTVVRDALPVALLTFEGYQPVAARVLKKTAGVTLQVGDIVWACDAQLVPVTTVTTGGQGTSSTARGLPVSDVFASGGAAVVTSAPAVEAAPSAESGAAAAAAPPSATGSAMETNSAQGSGADGAASNLPTSDVFSAATRPLVVPEVVVPPPAATAGQGVSRSGVTGLIRMPSANVIDDGVASLTFFGTSPEAQLASPADRGRIGTNKRYEALVGVLPGLELGLSVGRLGNDLNGNFKLRLTPERRGLPSIAIGASELFKTQGDKSASYFGVLGKSILHGRVNLTTGLVFQRGAAAAGKGAHLFGGVELAVARGLSAVLEHDSRDVNYGLRASLFGNRMLLAVEHLKGGWTYQTTLQLPLSRGATTVLPADHLARPGLLLPATEAATSIQRRLVAAGLENVAVRMLRSADGGPVPTAEIAQTVEVAYENRSYPHSEIAALADVFATAAEYAPQGWNNLSIIVQRSGLPMLRLSCQVEDYRQFMAGHLDEKSFAAGLTVENTLPPKRDHSNLVTASTGTAARSFGHADLFLRPQFNYEISERFVLGGGFDARPEVSLPLARGIEADARAVIPVSGPVRSQHGQVDRAALNLFARSRRPLLGHVAVGHFPTFRDGLVSELVWLPSRGQVLVRAAATALRRSDGVSRNQAPTFILEGRYYLPALNLSTRLTAGRFLEGDTGVTLGFLRRFGNSEVALELRRTTIGKAGLITLSLPLGPQHLGSRPSTLRVRPPDFYEFNYRSLLTHPDFLSVASRVGNQVDDGSTIERFLLDRDRLNEPYILRSLPRLRRLNIGEPVLKTFLALPATEGAQRSAHLMTSPLINK